VIAQCAGGEAGAGNEPCFDPMTTTVHPLRARACLVAAALASLCSTPLQAQPMLRETRVLATRFPEPADTLPLGVSIVTADEIQASGATSVNEALIRLLGVPGRQDLLGTSDYTLDLRGFGVTADQNQVVVIDGVRLSEADLAGTRLSGIPVESVERIEVLRGNGAVLYGEGATGGVIVITTRAGSGREQGTGGSVYGAAGSHGLRDLRANARVSTAAGFALDAQAQNRESDGYRRHQRAHLQAGSATGQWSNGWLRLGARVAQDKLDAQLPGSLTAAEFAADPRQVEARYRNDQAMLRNERAGVFAQADVGPWQLAFDAGQREKKLRSTNTGFAFDYDVEASNYGLRARHDAKIGAARNALVLGVDVNEWKREVPGAFGSRASQRSRGFYAKDDVTLAGGTRISLGGRTERFDKDITSAGTTTALEDREHAWELGVSQPLGAGWTGYARTGRSFRLANVEEFNFTTPGVPLQPQVSRDHEIGARRAYAQGKLEARLYRSDLRDEIGFDPNAIGPSSVFGFNGANVNFDPTRRQGVEVDWTHALTTALGLRVNAALRKASFRSGPYAGKDVPLVPRRALAVRADWTPAAGHRVSGGVNWVSAQYPDFTNTCRIPAYTTADARYAWQFHPQAEVAVGVSNLFDRKYSTQAFGCLGNQATSVYPEPGRQVTASLQVRF
jgi:iron complex outermembrane receptor protein